MENSAQQKDVIQIEKDIISLLENEDVQVIEDYLKSLPKGSFTQVRTKIATYKFKSIGSCFEVRSNIVGWVTTLGDARALALLLLNKNEFLDFDWE